MRNFNCWRPLNNTINQINGVYNNLIIISSIRPFEVESVVELELLHFVSNIAYKNNKPETLVWCVNSYTTVV